MKVNNFPTTSPSLECGGSDFHLQFEKKVEWHSKACRLNTMKRHSIVIDVKEVVAVLNFVGVETVIEISSSISSQQGYNRLKIRISN